MSMSAYIIEFDISFLKPLSFLEEKKNDQVLWESPKNVTANFLPPCSHVPLPHQEVEFVSYPLNLAR